MSNEALDVRIARDFMGWKYEYCTTLADPRFAWFNKDDYFMYDDFKPTTDMRAAYLVLEKIASVYKIDIFNVEIANKEGLRWIVYGPPNGSGEHRTLPLAISKLAEAIMDSPEHMELFK